MTSNSTLNQTIKELKDNLAKNIRMHIRLDRMVIQQITEFTSTELTNDILCLLNFSTSVYKKFDSIIIKELSKEQNSERIIFLLKAYENHIVQGHNFQGVKIPPQYLSLLIDKWQLKNWEIRYWCLVIIEQLGQQGKIFIPYIIIEKRNVFLSFNFYKRKSLEMISSMQILF